MVTAAPQDQWRLLDVQEHDTRLAQLAHRRRSLPELAEIGQQEVEERRLTDEAVVARTTAGDLKRQVAKAEVDVEQVRSRMIRSRARLDSGQGPAKELQGLQHEIETLSRRQGVLEDEELEVMERLEVADVAVAAVQGELDKVQQQLVALHARVEEQVGEIDGEVASVQRARADSAAGVPKPLLDLYEKVRERTGLGAAKLFQQRCEGCRLQLTAQEMGQLRSAAADAVFRHEECGRILVRTADSGL